MLSLIRFSYTNAYSCNASTDAKEETTPKVIKRSIQGIGEFAVEFEAFLESYPHSILITDGDGVITRHSTPLANGIVYSRGDMPAYLDYLHEVRKILLVLASAWNQPPETFHRVGNLHLNTVFDLQKPVEEGIKKFKDISYFYIRKGNVISAKQIDLANPFIYFRQKALTPLIIFGDDFCCDQVVFIDDSSYNHKVFMKDIVTLPFYSKLKQIVLFEISEIKGEISEKDTIDEKYLPAPYKEKWASLARNTGPQSSGSFPAEK